MALAGPEERVLTAKTNEANPRLKRRLFRMPPSALERARRRIEAMKGVSYLDRAPTKPAKWGYAR